MIKEITIEDLLKQSLVGKKLRVKTYQQRVISNILIYKKKSKNVTDEQFASKNLKYCQLVNRTKNLGIHTKFENLKIIDVKLDIKDYDWEGIVVELDLILENDIHHYCELNAKFINIYDDVYVIKNH